MNYKELCSDFLFDLAGNHPYGGFCDAFDLTINVIDMDLRMEYLGNFCSKNPFEYGASFSMGANNEIIDMWFNSKGLSYLSSLERLRISESILEEL